MSETVSNPNTCKRGKSPNLINQFALRMNGLTVRRIPNEPMIIENHFTKFLAA